MSYDFQTSYPAFKENPVGKDLCRSLVLVAIRKIQPCTDAQIADHLEWKINRVTGRRGELVTLGLIERVAKKKDPETNRTVNYWQVKRKVVQSELFG